MLNRCSTGTDRKRNDWVQKGCDKFQVVRESECANPAFVVQTTKSSAVSAHKTMHMEETSSVPGEEQKGGVGVTMGALVVVAMVFLVAGWITYAYRNPHTKSGQFLIQVSKGRRWGRERVEWRYLLTNLPV